MIAAENAIREWVNANEALVDPRGDDDDRPIARGAYLRSQRSPADGPYLVLTRAFPGGEELPVAERDERMGMATITAEAYAGTEEMAELAAVAYFNAVTTCTGRPQACGRTGVAIFAYDQLSGPAFVQYGPDSGEAYSFQVTCRFLLGYTGPPANPQP